MTGILEAATYPAMLAEESISLGCAPKTTAILLAFAPGFWPQLLLKELHGEVERDVH